MSEKTIKEVVQKIRALRSMKDLNPEEYAVEGGWADIVAKEADIKATQLRRIFHYVKDLKLKYQRDPDKFNRASISMLMPMFAYAKGRGHIKQDFYELLTLCFGPEKCQTAEDFESAANFLEAIMAYHKYYHSKD
ncbi:MAG: type III-A CRISPR-associated protein Csm2 [Thermanaerothrix sp.]|uniref:type III-A CRISPR-associated protein Csm2 n=1 Tax=Thermanaerothrix sp. TaxID=2972675 RepID=UPI003C7D4FCA